MKTENESCPVCGEGHLIQNTRNETVEYNGVKGVIDGMVFSVCNACGSDLSGPNESRHNKRLVLEFRRSVDGFLGGDQIRELRKSFGITQQQAAAIFGGGTVAFSKYEAGDVTQSQAMDRLLRVAYAIPGAFNWLARKAGIATGPAIQEEKVFIESRVAYAIQYTSAPVHRGRISTSNIVLLKEEKYETESPIPEALPAA